MNDFQNFLTAAANVKPSKRQLDWFDTEFYAFAHLSPNTFTGLEWGLGNEDPAIFNPAKLDCDQWVEAVKSAGMKGLVITAKHHDGFCLWHTKQTDHSVLNSPFKRDIVKECAEACRRGGIKFGFYLSPWDRHSPLYGDGTGRYNEYYKAQLLELLTGYGDVFHIWFDGACGEGPDGKKQEYSFREFIELIRKYQPNATVFNDRGPDVRWCGNEAGTARHAEWAVVPSELCTLAEVQTGPSPIKGDLSFMQNCDMTIGDMSNIMYSKGLVFAGAEIDMSIRKGWFWHEEEDPHSLDKLFNTYLNSVGANACLHLNVPPNRDGLFDERDVKRLKELGDHIKKELGHDHAAGCETKMTKRFSDTQCVYEVKLPETVPLRYIELREDIAEGQRVESFTVEFFGEDGENLIEYTTYTGTCIGHKKICAIARDMWEFKGRGVRVTIRASRGEPKLLPIRIY